MLRVVGSAGTRARPANQGRPSRSGHRRVPSLMNFHPVGLVGSATGLKGRNARSPPSNPGSEKPAVLIMWLRCGSACPPGLAVMSVFGSAPPDELLAFLRLTVPTIGLPGRNSLVVPAWESG